jgi:hypothetical protein
VLSGVRLSDHAGTAPATRPRHRPGSTSPAAVRCPRSRSAAAASGTTTWPSSNRTARWARCRPSRAGGARVKAAA